MTKRYDFIEETRETYAGSVESKDGKYVKWSDYERLADELKELSKVDYDKDNLISVYEKQLTKLREKLRWIPVEDYEQSENNNGPLECIVNYNFYDDSFDVYSLCIDEGPYFKILDPILNNSTDYRVTHVRRIPELGDEE